MQRSHKIKLEPNNTQASYFKRACGVKRFVYNWALEEWARQYKAGGKPSAFQLKKEFNALKREKFPFVTVVTKCAAEGAFSNIDRAFKNFFKKRTRYPKFKKRGERDSFYLTNTAFKVSGKFLIVPKLGKVKMSEELRFAGKLVSAVVSSRAGKWFVSISVDISDRQRETQAFPIVGIDLGLLSLATLSDGKVVDNPRNLTRFHKKIRRANKSLARKVKGSENWKKAKRKLADVHYKLSCARLDYIHKATSWISKNYSGAGVENLNVKGMLRNRKLSKGLSDAAFSEFTRQLQYKVGTVVVIDRWFPSTKLCPVCGAINEIPLSQRVYECACGYGPVQRDFHAARNILTEAIRQGLPDYKPVESEALVTCSLK